MRKSYVIFYTSTKKIKKFSDLVPKKCNIKKMSVILFVTSEEIHKNQKTYAKDKELENVKILNIALF